MGIAKTENEAVSLVRMRWVTFARIPQIILGCMNIICLFHLACYLETAIPEQNSLWSLY